MPVADGEGGLCALGESPFVFRLGGTVSANQRATVSLLMIVRNEERQLADCLSPVASLFDEIVSSIRVPATRPAKLRRGTPPRFLIFPGGMISRRHGMRRCATHKVSGCSGWTLTIG